MELEQATLIDIRRSKKGKIIGSIEFADGKRITIPEGTKGLDESFNNKPCEVLRPKGPITRLLVDGKELYNALNTDSKQAKASIKNHHKEKYKHGRKPIQKHKNQQEQKNTATAPYNFIQLNETVVKGQELPSFDRYDKERYTGYIDCELETLTPLYIRDTYTYKELEYKEKQKKEGKCGDNPDFFSPKGHPSIPGSSLRGMVRTLVEIIGWGKFGFFDGKRRLFYRDVGGNTELGRHYRSLMMNEDDYYFPKIQAGILKQQDNKWAIHPSKEIGGTQIYKVNYNVRNREVAGNSNIKPREFTFMEIYFKPVSPTLHEHIINNKKTIKLKYAEVKDISTKPAKGYEKGYLISTGNFSNKKHMHWIINVPTGVADDVLYLSPNSHSMELYKSDETRDERADLFKMLSKHTAGVPCFYLQDEDETILLGHTGMFRIPYQYTIGDYVPKQLTDDSITDMAESIFGKTSEFATRVYFEDAELLPGQSNKVSQNPTIPQILSGPKPTTYQHYLEPDEHNKANHWNAKNKNNDIKIRGNKLYWHRDNVQWELDRKKNGEVNSKLITYIKPVQDRAKFKTKIRFENLTKEELGLLLCALDLPEGHCHKLGMGKPLGLGSVKITPTLYIEDREKRYKNLFEQEQWFLAAEKQNMEHYKQAYEQYLLDKLDKQEKIKVHSMWDTKRLQQLKTMLSWENTKISVWREKTRYMELKEFEERRVLPKPEQVSKK